MKTIVLAFILLTAAAQAQTLETFLKLWNDPAVAGRIASDIEKHRKGDATIEVVDADGKPVSGATVVVQQTRHEFLFGCNLFVLDQLETPELNAKYERAFANLFNFATLPFYWRDLEPEQGKLRFVEDSPYIWRRPPPDRLVKWCKANSITPKGHALMYAKNKFMPDWTARNKPETFLRQAAKHMAEIAERYKRDIPIWDAVNEEMPRLKNLSEWHAVPNDYLAWCFREVGRLFPKTTQLLINDGTSQAHVTTSEYEAMIKGLLQQRVRVSGIGIQFHGGRYPPQQLFAVYEQLGRLGLPLYITEITIPATGQDGATRQGVTVANLYRLWFSTPKMAGITWWNLGDGTAYGNENKSLGGLLDKDMNPKPAYRELDRLINHEWKTSTTLKTDAKGKAHFRGFHGKYSIQVTVGRRQRQFSFELKSGTGQNQARFIL